ncbi:MAG: alkaline phosphatase D family protein [Gammaproteobacteria bacterium]|nr:alkaline phosphatase D family protein [Gammaproteobacteria bacterium]
MTVRLDRRQLLLAAGAGLGALALPGIARAFEARGFTHGVASGEPDATSVLLWSRYVADREVRLDVEVATDAMLARVVARAEALADPERDHTARVVVRGLEPGRWYFYRFIAPDGSRSPVGRTRTLPQGDVTRFGIGLFSCSNLGYGWFNAYAHACERADLDLIVHVGDYFYEYESGKYPAANVALPGRLLQPTKETVTLEEYRLRHACYRLDPDLQRLHQSYPTVVQWDDHEFANNSWMSGAENHQPATEGDWESRKRAAERAYRDWLPVSADRWCEYQIGTLATLFKAETRISGRSAPPDLEAAFRGKPDLGRALREFREGTLHAPERTLLGAAQESWLQQALGRSTAAKTRWQVLAQQVVMGEVIAPQEAAGWIGKDAAESVRKQLAAGLAAARAGIGYNLDSWDGFPAARRRLLEAAANAGADLVVLSGDSHNAWANDLALDRTPVGVEFATHSVTSPGFETNLPGAAPERIATALLATNPGLAYVDTSRRGYTSLTLTPDAVTGQFHFLRSIRERGTALAETRRITASRSARRFTRD